MTTPRDPPALQDQVVHPLLEQVQARLLLQGAAHERLVELAVGLGAGGAYRRPLAGVEDAPLDTGGVRGPGHEAAQGVDLPHQVALADAADGRVAGHLAQGLDVLGQEQGAGPAACRGQGRLAPGVTAAHHDHLIGFVRRP